MKKIVSSLVSPTPTQQKWSTIFFVGTILTAAALGFIVDGYHDTLNQKNFL
ncbi:hypothetical protein [Marinomonas ostreistagni]|uniref:Uncharacterized protein n=1 Tax=Marinomonas ostreistagni TaxID=359209 RepID=A0ABS0ZCH2_9GAMM|nr:hypothetical protein [Marinomonas ostreistagni]MBJ7551330.1 hypothetical protein [Marinomonas ostreistagni]